MRRKPCVFLPFLLVFLFLLMFVRLFRQPSSKFSSSGVECEGFAITKNSVWALPHFRCLHCTRLFLLGTPGSAPKSRRLVALWLVPLVDDHDSTNFLKIGLLCNDCLSTSAISSQPFASVGALIVSWKVGCAIGSHFGYLLMIPSNRPMSRIGSSKFQIFSFPEIRRIFS